MERFWKVFYRLSGKDELARTQMVKDMNLANYKELCSRILNVPVSTIHITQNGELKLSYYRNRIPVVREEHESLFKLLQAQLYAEFESKRELEEEKRRNEALKNALRTRLELFDGIGMELRDPLNAVVNLSDALVDRELPDPSGRMVSTIHRSAQQLSRLVEDALSLNALDRGQMKVNPVVMSPRHFLAALEQELAPIGLRHKATLVCRADDQLPLEIVADYDKLYQITQSLVYFGFLKQDEPITVNLALSWFNSGLSISVSAPDLELTPAETEALLQPWPQPDELPMGLSMTVANTLIGLMGGQLKVADQPNPGSILRAWIPAELSEEQQVKELSASHLSEQGVKILAADDDPTSLFVLEHVVSKLGYEMTTVESGTGALKELATRDYKLLLLDLYMPGMDGFEVARAVKKEIGQEIPIIAMSSDTTDLARARAAEVGMTDFLSKPLKRERLAQVMRRALSRAF